MNTKILFFSVITMVFVGMGIADWAKEMEYTSLEFCGLSVMFGCVGILLAGNLWLNPKDFF